MSRRTPFADALIHPNQPTRSCGTVSLSDRECGSLEWQPRIYLSTYEFRNFPSGSRSRARARNSAIRGSGPVLGQAPFRIAYPNGAAARKGRVVVDGDHVMPIRGTQPELVRGDTANLRDTQDGGQLIAKAGDDFQRSNCVATRHEILTLQLVPFLLCVFEGEVGLVPGPDRSHWRPVAVWRVIPEVTVHQSRVVERGFCRSRSGPVPSMCPTSAISNATELSLRLTSALPFVTCHLSLARHAEAPEGRRGVNGHRTLSVPPLATPRRTRSVISLGRSKRAVVPGSGWLTNRSGKMVWTLSGGSARWP